METAALLKRIRNVLAYGVATVVILLAVMVGLFRLFLPRLTDYQEDIKTWATAAIGVEVDFAGMDARWRLSGPELNFYQAELTRRGDDESLIEAGEVTIGVGLLRLLVDRTLVVDRLLVSDTALEFSEDEAGVVRVQGLLPDELAELVPASGEGGDVVVEARDVAVRFLRQGEAPFTAVTETLEATRRDDVLTVRANVEVDDGLGSRLTLAADRVGDPAVDAATWRVVVDGRAMSLARWAALIPTDFARVASGYGDLSLELQVDDQGLARATADTALQDVSVIGAALPGYLDIEGRFEYVRTERGMLMSASNASLVTATGRWPDSSLSAEIDSGDDGRLSGLRATATYLALSDADYFTPWLPEVARDALRRYAPSGEIRNLRVSLGELDSDAPHYDVAAEAYNVGVAATEPYPGVQGLSGTLRADTDGGRAELDAAGLTVDVPKYLPEPVVLDEASGTLIWRRSGEQLTVLSDRLAVRSGEFEGRSSLELKVPAPDAAPVVDLDANWEIFEIAAAKRLIPASLVHPELMRWFDRALVSGRVSEGRTRISGPLDGFPFDGGDGVFEVTAVVEDAVLNYATGWPPAEISSMDVQLNGMHLATDRNVATAAGNRTTNARVEIADLRKPVLTISAPAEGTLETIRQFGLASPIAGVFAGRLDDVTVDGDATFTLDLTYPILDRAAYTFEAVIQPNGGSVAFSGFPAPVTDLSGNVTIRRDALSSDSLAGRFLGEPVEIDLRSTDDTEPGYRVLLDATGIATAEGLIDGLNAPLEGAVRGAAPYAASLQFPRPGSGGDEALNVAVTSSLEGFEIALPAPLAKPAEDSARFDLTVDVLADGRIAARGTMAGDTRFLANFDRDENGWDFDRGSLTLGQGTVPEVPDSRGLHIKGLADSLRLEEWLALSDSGGGSGRGFVERIRSIDLTVGELRAFGQLLPDHQVRLDRSGSEWYVTAAGEELEGTATIPYNLDGGRPIVLDMERLLLPGDDTTPVDDAGSVAEVDPRGLPPVEIHANDFGIGERRFGRLDVSFEKTINGLFADDLAAEDDSFGIEGSAAWLANPATGQTRTVLTAELVSRDVKQTLSRLGYGAVIDAEDMTIAADLSWPGGPRADFLEAVSGEVSVRLDSGMLEEVEPGAGRVFGLMSVVELPRRLSLDFRDVFDKGFGFDEIRGNFRLDTGDAYTCDLSLKGPAADIGIVGRVGLAEGVYEQTAVVSANVGNTLPVVGAVVAGPQVAAALLIFSQIFKKPLQEMGQVYYQIEGDLETPVVDGADADRFAATSRAADCLPVAD